MNLRKRSDIGLTNPINSKDTHGFLLDGVDEFINLNRTYDFTDGVGNDKPFSLYFKGKILDFTRVHYLISKLARFSTDPGNAFGLLVLTTGEVRLVLTESLVTNGSLSATTVSTLSLDTTYEIVATYNGDKTTPSFHIYINGVDQTLNVVNSAYSGMDTSSLNITVGAKGDTYAPYMYGEVHEVAIYDKVLTQDEVTKIYNGADPSNYEGCIDYAKLGDSAYFSTGDWRGRNLSRFNNAVWTSVNLEESDRIEI